MVSLLVLQQKNTPRAGASASAQQKARRGLPPGRLGAVLVNMLFWKILVTRVKRKMRRKKNMTRQTGNGLGGLSGPARSSDPLPPISTLEPSRYGTPTALPPGRTRQQTSAIPRRQRDCRSRGSDRWPRRG